MTFILLVKDFSRFSRRNSRGLVELEDLCDASVRMISIGYGIDLSKWQPLKWRPVTDNMETVGAVLRGHG